MKIKLTPSFFQMIPSGRFLQKVVTVTLALTVLQTYIIMKMYEPSEIIKKIIKSKYDTENTLRGMRIQMQSMYNENDLDYHQQVKLSAHMLPEWDYTHLGNIRNFRYHTFNNVCSNVSPFLLIFVTSAPRHTQHRKVIRQTWGNMEKQKDVKLLFSLASVKTEEQDIIEEENRKYHDIIQGNFLDTYLNVTYKHIMNLKYAVYYCPDIKYILKTDDDFFVNINAVLNYLRERYLLCGAKDYIQCGVAEKFPVFRRSRKFPQWVVKFEDYERTVYPTYCMGGYAMVYSWDVAFKMYQEAQRGDTFWMEDAYMTGILGERIGLKHQSFANQSLEYWEMIKFIVSAGTIGRKNFLFGYFGLDPDKILSLGKLVENVTTEVSVIGSC